MPPLADATGGDPPASVLQFSPHLGAALLAQPDCVSSVWPAFGDLRSAARATKPSRFRLVVCATTSEARLVFGACFLLAQRSVRPSEHPSTLPGATLHSWLQTLLAHGSALFRSTWHWSREQCQLFHTHLCMVVAPAPWVASAVPVLPFSMDAFSWSLPPVPYPAPVCTFLHALRVGAPWHAALDIFGGLPDGFLSADGTVFALPALRDPSGAPDRAVALADSDAADALTLFFAPAGLVPPVRVRTPGVSRTRPRPLRLHFPSGPTSSRPRAVS